MRRPWSTRGCCAIGKTSIDNNVLQQISQFISVQSDITYILDRALNNRWNKYDRRKQTAKLKVYKALALPTLLNGSGPCTVEASA
jgi:hypothetical protein